MFKIIPDTRDIAALAKRLTKKSVDHSEVTAAIAGVMLDAVEENFEQEGRPVRWQPLSPVTIEKRTEDGTWPGKILQASGILAASVQKSSDKNSATVSTNMPYAAIQHGGGRAGRNKSVAIPARPYMHLAHEDVLEMEDLLADWLDNL